MKRKSYNLQVALIPMGRASTHNGRSGLRSSLVLENEVLRCPVQPGARFGMTNQVDRGDSPSRPQRSLPRTPELRHDTYRTRRAAFQIFFSESFSRFQASSRAFLFASFLSLGSSPARMKPWPAPS